MNTDKQDIYNRILDLFREFGLDKLQLINLRGEEIINLTRSIKSNKEIIQGVNISLEMY